MSGLRQFPVVVTARGRSTGDQSLTTQNALQNATGHSFTIGPNQEWIATFDLDVGAA